MNTAGRHIHLPTKGRHAVQEKEPRKRQLEANCNVSPRTALGVIADVAAGSWLCNAPSKARSPMPWG